MILDDIVSYTRIQVKKEKEKIPLNKLLVDYQVPVRDFKGALKDSGISIIAEIKKASPSKGVIRQDFSPQDTAKVYELINIDAISVLTEDRFFQGSLEYINLTKKVSSKPVLRKDFIVDEYQLYQTRAFGGDGALLIAEVLGNRLKKFYNLAKELGLYPLVEVHNLTELENALNSGCDIIGINNRDLKTFKVDMKTTENLIKDIPEGIIVVSESGIKAPEDIKYLRSLGVDAVLIGEIFMRNMDNIEEIKEFIRLSKGSE